MTRRRSSFQVLALILTFGVAALPAPLFASGFQLVEQNASGLGNAYAGQAAGVKNASAIYFNPAALTRVPGWNVVVSLEPIGVGTTFNDSGSTRPSLGGVAFPVPAGGSGGDAGGWIPVPNGYVSGQVGERAWIGISVNAPFGLETDWEADWLGRFHAQKSKVEAININPTIAFQLSDVLSVGFGADYQHLSAELGQSVAYGGISYFSAFALGGPAAAGGILAQLGGAPGLALEGPALIEGTSSAWGWNAGALLQLGEQAHVGFSYRSKVKHDVEGDATFGSAPTFAETGPLGALGAGLNARFASGPVKTTIELPDTYSVAAAWENESLQLLADWTYTRWESIQSLDIVRSDDSPLTSVPLAFENTWRAGVGANVKLNEAFTLRLGTAYDKAPVQDEFRTPRLPDNDRIWAAGGFEWKLSQRARVDVGYAHIFIDDAPSSLPNQATATSTPVGALVGTYNAKVDILGAQLTLSF
jgi:long-chain fatty acid transport protein